MADNKSGEEVKESRSIQEILAEQDRLNKILQDEFKKEMTILFTDICGYTEFMETRGDLGGRAMLQKHNDIVMPLIEAHHGRVVKTIGDAVMAVFAEPLEAAQAAVAIQKGLAGHNEHTGVSDRIHVRIGINRGEVLLDEADVFGDAVNVAARIEAKAARDQILISADLYERICGSDDILCRFHGAATLKGKAQPLELYRVVWGDEETTVSGVNQVRAGTDEQPRIKQENQSVFKLEVTRENDRLKISAYEQHGGVASTVRHYEEIPVDMTGIKSRCLEMVETLNRANRSGRMGRDVLVQLRAIGQGLADELFTPRIKEKINATKAEYLLVTIDDQLVQIPWELLHDGQQFLCQRFSMGRLVRTRQAVVGGSRQRSLGKPLKMMIIADPKGDLKGAYAEGTQLRDVLDSRKDLVNVALRSANITVRQVKEKIRNFDLIHFAGHCDYNQEQPGDSGWRLTDGRFTGDDIIKMAGSHAMPALIFSNSCQSARTEEWLLDQAFQDKIFGQANAFILAGVQHYIGTFWEIMDEPSRRFALEFYKQQMSGLSIGAAVKQARLALIKEYGEETFVWASYLLYGDPTVNYLEQIQAVEEDERPGDAAPVVVPASRVRAREEVVDFTAAPETTAPKRPGPWRALVVLALLALLGLGWWFFPSAPKEDFSPYETAALTAYQAGDYEAALAAAGILAQKKPGEPLPLLIEADIAFSRGQLDKARAAYDKATTAKGPGHQVARAWMGLGRIASIDKESEKALSCYQKASELAPGDSSGYLAQAMLLDAGGKPEQAVNLLNKARSLNPDDQTLIAAANDVGKRLEVQQDQEKQARIDNLIKDLLADMQSPPRAPADDGWTSKPLTLWLMDFSSQGYSLQEGEERLLSVSMTDLILAKGKVQLVERALLDKLLAELKMGSSDLADQRTALALGKILAARLVLSGQIIYSGPQTQVFLRLIETETGRISASVSESFGSLTPPSLSAEKIVAQLDEKIMKAYPRRGKISGVKGDEISLNIGSLAGVAEGDIYLVNNNLATLEVLAVQPESSLARVSAGEKQLATGLKVEQGKKEEKNEKGKI